jgi:hypothetical protein
MIIYCNYFSDPGPARRQEYLYCIKKNQQLDFVDKIYVFLESADDRQDITDPNKIEFITLGRRMEFQDVFVHGQENVEPGTVLAILNLDIFIEDSDAWRNIDRDFFKVGHPSKSMILKRTDLLDLNGTVSVAKQHWKHGDFCDGWVFQTPFDAGFLSEDFNFCVGGAPGCDNVMMYLMNKYYHTYSWGEKYRTFHLDICRKPGSPGTKILNDKTDLRAKNRRDEHARIPGYQNWEYQLRSQQRPHVIFKTKQQ